jgi:secreted trypsin-like serine protease
MIIAAKYLLPAICILSTYVVLFTAVLAQDAKDSTIVGTTPYDDTVAKFQTKLVPKIFNGEKAAAGSSPWQVALTASLIGDPIQAFFCSGSIYSETWIITAAHCLTTKDTKGKLSVLEPGQILIVYGTNVLKPGVLEQKVAKIILHDGFNRQTFDNDIAVIKLTSSLTFDHKIKSIPVIGSAEEPAILKGGALLTVTGWGSTSPAAEHANLPVRELRVGKVEFVTDDICTSSISGNTITSNMICTSSDAVDVCTGDSGGPIVQYPTATHPKLLGVVSGNWVGDCGNYDYQRHTRIARFGSWLEKCTVSPDSCPSWKP